jgi:hypothetical protein
MVLRNGLGRVEIRCDGCLRAAATTAGIRSWDVPADARADLVGPQHGWSWVDGQLRCARCARVAACQVVGHTFGRWEAQADDGLAVRVCRACGLDEHAPAYVLAPVPASDSNTESSHTAA